MEDSSGRCVVAVENPPADDDETLLPLDGEPWPEAWCLHCGRLILADWASIAEHLAATCLHTDCGCDG